MYVWRTIFLNHDIRVSSKWAKNIKSSSELQLFNPQIPIWNILLEISTLRKKSTISSTGRDTYTPSRAKSVVKKDNLELSGKKKKKNKKTAVFHHCPTFQKVLICMDLSAVPIHQLSSAEEAKFIIRVLTSTLLLVVFNQNVPPQLS